MDCLDNEEAPCKKRGFRFFKYIDNQSHILIIVN